MFGFGTAGAMKPPYMVYPEIRGKDQYFLASETMPCKIYEVDFRFEDVEGKPKKKMRMIQVLQSNKDLNVFELEGYGNHYGQWILEFWKKELESIGLTINGHKIALKADMDSNQIVSQLTQLGTVTVEDSTINFLSDKKNKK